MIRHKVIRFWSLTPPERLLFCLAMVVLSFSGLGLRCFGFQQWYAALSRWVLPQHPQVLTAVDITIRLQLVLQLMQWTLRHSPFRGNCLSRSLTLWWLLRQQGLEGTLRIGTRFKDGQFQAHAWVEYDGQPLNEEPQVYYTFTVFAQAIKPL